MISGKNQWNFWQKNINEMYDENNPLTIKQMFNVLQEVYDISVRRMAISKDIEELIKFALDIVTIHSIQSKYFLKSRLFNIDELKVLIDAVEVSKVIVSNKNRELVNKI